MPKIQKSRNLYPHPFSRAYWHDAALELKDTKMLVITALMIALRVALKPLAIPLGPQLSIQTAMLATALGAMIYGPVMAIPAALISDTIGFLVFPTGDYFFPFVLTEIGSTMAYALCLYRARPNTRRVALSRFLICFVINMVLQQFIFAWYYSYIGSPDKAKDAIMGIMTVARIFKNLAMFPIESVVLTLFLRFVFPVIRRAKLVYCEDADMNFSKKAIITLVCLTLVGLVSAAGYLSYRYNTTSRTTEYSAEEVVSHNKEMHEILLAEDHALETPSVAVIEYASQKFLGKEITYTVAHYAVTGEVSEGTDEFEALWSLKKTPASKHEALTRAGTATIVTDTKGNLVSIEYEAVS